MTRQLAIEISITEEVNPSQDKRFAPAKKEGTFSDATVSF